MLLLGGAPAAQDQPDLSGRWRLVQPSASQLAEETLSVSAADELFVAHSFRDIIITHAPQGGTAPTHPEAGIFQYGAGSFIDALPGTKTVVRGQWGVTHIGTQLMISRTTIYPPDERGEQRPVARGSMWRLEGDDRLVVEFGEERAGERPKIAMRVYARIPWR
jgi:hypothetical protein